MGMGGTVNCFLLYILEKWIYESLDNGVATWDSYRTTHTGLALYRLEQLLTSQKTDTRPFNLKTEMNLSFYSPWYVRGENSKGRAYKKAIP